MSDALQTLSLSQLSLYNPARMSDPEIIGSFAARENLFNRITKDIIGERSRSRPQHHLIVGQRGMGKSTLLARIAAEIRNDVTLDTSLIPLAFPEEQYAVDRLSKFWLNCLDSLADACERKGDHTSVDRIDKRVQTLTSQLGNSVKDDEEASECALEEFLEETRTLGRRPVLFVDNLQIVFDRLDRKQQHTLRELLMRDGAPILIGASPSPPESSKDYAAAFYDLFKIHFLPALTADEMRTLMLHLAEKVNRPDIRSRILQHPHRIQVLRQLTGGNPRTTVTLFFLFAEDFAPSVFGDLENLLDRVTPLYKARFEELSNQQQVIASAVANHWDPVTARAIGEATGLRTTTLNGQLERMSMTGVVEKVDLFGETSVGYQISERFFNVWFLMRNASRRQRREVEFLTRFIESFYDTQDRSRLAKHLESECNMSPDRHLFARALSTTLPMTDAQDLNRHAELDALRQKDREARHRLEEIIDFNSFEPSVLAFSELEERLQSLVPQSSKVKASAFATAVLGDQELFKSGGREQLASQAELSEDQIERVLNSIQQSYEENILNYGQDVAEWIHKRLSKGHLSSQESLKDWETTFKKSPCKSSTRALVDALLPQTAKRLEPPTMALIKKQLRPNNDASAVYWLDWARKLQFLLSQFEDAENAYLKATEQDGNNALPWDGLGDLYQTHMRRYEDADQAYRQAIKRNEKLANSWNGIGELNRFHLHRYAEAEEAYRNAIKYRENWARPWQGLGDLLRDHLGRFDEAEDAYSQAIQRDENSAFSWNGLGDLLQYHSDRHREAENAYRKAIKIDDNLAFPWQRLGDLLRDHLGKFEEAEIAYNQAIQRDENSAFSWNGLGDLYQRHMSRYNEAENAYQKAIECDKNLAFPWYGMAELMRLHLGRYGEAEKAYRGAIERDATWVYPWHGLGTLLRDELGRIEEAESAYLEAIRCDKEFVSSWIGLGYLYEYHLKKFHEAESAYQTAIKLDRKIAYPWNRLGNLYFDHLGRFQEATEAFEKTIELDHPNAEIPLHKLLFLQRDFLGKDRDAAKTLNIIQNLPTSSYPEILTLQQGIFAAYESNWGEVRDNLKKSVTEGFRTSMINDWMYASAVFFHLGFGEQLILFLKDRGENLRLRPWFESLLAINQGDVKVLKNIAPEIRVTAEENFYRIKKFIEKLPNKTKRWDWPNRKKTQKRKPILNPI